MDQEVNFKTVKTWDNKIQFTADKITITVDGYINKNGKHYIVDPYNAKAHFVCNGKLYNVVNTNGVETVEDWYLNELLPKYQLLHLLISTAKI